MTSPLFDWWARWERATPVQRQLLRPRPDRRLRGRSGLRPGTRPREEETPVASPSPATRCSARAWSTFPSAASCASQSPGWTPSSPARLSPTSQAGRFGTTGGSKGPVLGRANRDRSTHGLLACDSRVEVLGQCSLPADRARAWTRSPCGPNRLSTSAGWMPSLPNQCGTLVLNSATSPAVSTRSWSPRINRM